MRDIVRILSLLVVGLLLAPSVMANEGGVGEEIQTPVELYAKAGDDNNPPLLCIEGYCVESPPQPGGPHFQFTEGPCLGVGTASEALEVDFEYFIPIYYAGDHCEGYEVSLWIIIDWVYAAADETDLPWEELF